MQAFLQRVVAVIELKIRYGDLEETIKEGLAQTWEYMDRCNTECERQHEGKKITVWGM